MKRKPVINPERVLFRPVEVARRWGTDRTTIYRQIADGRLKALTTPFGIRISTATRLRA